MPNYKFAFLTSTVLAVSNAIFPLSSFALSSTFTSQATFLNNVKPNFYLEDFNSAVVKDPLTFSNNGFSYTVTAVNLNNPTVSPKPFFVNTLGTLALSTDLINFTSIFISFTSGNVTAVGGNIFTTRGTTAQTNSMTATLNDGSTLGVNSTTTAPGAFTGFTSNTPITSLTISVDNGSNRNPNLDNFYVGAAVPVPFEFIPQLGVLGLAGFWGMSKLYKTLRKG